jgi:thiol-disulfide isomerase/thioredoxin
MLRKQRLFSLIAVVVLLGISQSVWASYQTGDIAADFTLPIHGTSTNASLYDYAGQIIVLDFFAYWCGPCAIASSEFEPQIQQYYQNLGGNPASIPVKLISINIDSSSPAQTDAYIAQYGLETVLEDSDYEAFGVFGSNSIPQIAIINGATGGNHQQWEILYNQAGYGSGNYVTLRSIINGITGSAGSAPIAKTGSASTKTNTAVPITLSATDNGLPNPPGALTYTITSLPLDGVLRDPGNGIISSVPYSLLNYGNQVIYTPRSCFSGFDSFQFKANDGGIAPDGGDSNIATISISVLDIIYMADMNTNPGWTLDSLWQWGAPTGSGGAYGYPDPASGYTNANVIGYNLNGDYENSISSTKWATTPAIDCTKRMGVTLTFYRWLNVEQPAYDHAYIQVSNNGSDWTLLWQNNSTITDSSWSLQTFDISGIADNQPTVYIRWGMGISDPSWAYSGWNIDDVKLTGKTIGSDLDCDNRINFGDFSILAAHWFRTDCIAPSWCDRADLDKSGQVDLADLSTIINDWLE